MIKFIALFMLFATSAMAGPWARQFQDQKLPTQAMLEHYIWTAPVLGTSTAVAPATPLLVAGTTITPAANPDVARTVTLTEVGNIGSIISGSVVVNGMDALGHSITENILITPNQAQAFSGLKAFQTVSSVVVPAVSAANVSIAVGTGASLGLIRCLNNPGDVAWDEYGGAFEATRGVMRVGSQTDVAYNTFQSSQALDGAHEVDVLFFQNFRCY